MGFSFPVKSLKKKQLSFTNRPVFFIIHYLFLVNFLFQLFKSPMITPPIVSNLTLRKTAFFMTNTFPSHRNKNSFQFDIALSLRDKIFAKTTFNLHWRSLISRLLHSFNRLAITLYGHIFTVVPGNDALENSAYSLVDYTRPLNAKQQANRVSEREACSLINHV